MRRTFISCHKLPQSIQILVKRLGLFDLSSLTVEFNRDYFDLFTYGKFTHSIFKILDLTAVLNLIQLRIFLNHADEIKNWQKKAFPREGFSKIRQCKPYFTLSTTALNATG
jgi:hypothetical protein